MDALLNEMREMDKIVQQPQLAPKVNEVIKDASAAMPSTDQQMWPNDTSLAEFWQKSLAPLPEKNVWGWNEGASTSQSQYRPYQRPDYSRFFPTTATAQNSAGEKFFDDQQQTANDFFRDVELKSAEKDSSNEWAQSFDENKKTEEEFNDQYNKEFWDRLQDEWKKLSDENNREHPWLNDFSEYYDPYKEYKFDENNPMIDVENALEKGKAFLENGDIPSAVLCFESAVKQEPENAEGKILHQLIISKENSNYFFSMAITWHIAS